MLGRGLALFGVAFVALALLPNLRDLVGFPVGYLTFLAAIWFWTAQSTSWNILSGFSGYFSFGQGAFFGVGAYTTAILARSFDLDYFATVPFAGLAAVLVGLAIGGIAFRLRSLRGEIFALLTLAVPFILASLARIVPEIDGGQGVPVAVPSYPDFLGSFPDLYYRVTLATAMAGLAMAYAMQNSRLGWALFAVRDAEAVAEGLGVPTFRHKMLAIAFNALIAGVVGSVFALQVGFVTVESAFNLTVPLFVIVMSVLGGRSHWAGPLIGAAVVYTLQDYLADAGFADWSLIILGLILITLVVLAPNGLQQRMRRRPRATVAATAGPIAVLALANVWGGPVEWFEVALVGAAIVGFIPDRLVDALEGRVAGLIQRGRPVTVASAAVDPAPAQPPHAHLGLDDLLRPTVRDRPTSSLAMGRPLIEVRDVKKHFGGIHALDGVSLSIGEGELVGLVGPNGSGKTTLVGLMAGAMQPTDGDITVEGVSIVGMAPHRIAHLGVARTYQIPRPFESMTVRDNVAIAIMFGRTPLPLARARIAAEEHLELVGLSGLAGAHPSQVNLHERQLLEMARALATRPKVLLLDEALAGLNPVEIDNAVAVVRRIHDAGITIVIVEHLLRVVNQLATRIIVLDQGRTLAEGDPAAVMSDPGVVRAYLGKQAHA